MANHPGTDKKATILVVDDVPENLRLLVKILADEGYDVRPAADGKFAMESSKNDPPDLILLDVLMPGLDGYEVCKLFKDSEATKDIPIIFVTAQNTILSQTKGFDVGGVDYITKPIHPEVVLARVQTQLELKFHRDNLEELVKERTKELRKEIDTRIGVEESLRSSELKLTSIVDAFRGYIYATNPLDPYRITYMNRSLKEHLGFDGTGSLCYEVIFDRNLPCENCNLKEVGKTGFSEAEIQHSKTGKWYNVMHSLMTNTDSEKNERQSILIDITRQKQTQLDLKQKEEALKRENIRLKASMKERFAFGDIIGRSQPMQKVYETIIQASSKDSFVSIYGESGTGKELVAKAIHESSERNKGKLVSVNCGAIPENLAESEFFGHKKGAFTGADKDKIGFLEEADGGTLFLDEIGQISPSLQVKLLRVLDGYGFSPLGSHKLIKPNLRIITATNEDLKSLVKKGVMRGDFFYRIHVVPIQLPPLRERKEDIPLLTEHFLSGYSEAVQLPLKAKIMEALVAHDWPGNVRELQNTLNRFVTLGELDMIGQDLTEEHSQNTSDDLLDNGLIKDLSGILASVEKKVISKALNQNQWRRDKTAEVLGITQKTLYRRMKQFNLIK